MSGPISPEEEFAAGTPLESASSAEPTSRWQRKEVWIVCLLLLVAVCNAMDRGILALLQEPIKSDLGLTDTQLGLLSGPIFAIFYSLSGIPIARLAERFNRPALLATAIAFWSSVTALCSLATNFVQMAALRAGLGIGESGASPISHSLIGDTFSVRRRGLVMSIFATASPIAGILVPLTIGLIAHVYGWRAAFLVAAVPGLILAGLLVLTVRDPRRNKERLRPPQTFAVDFRWLAGNRAFVFLFLGAAFNGIGVQGIGVFTTSFLIRTHSLDLAEAGAVMSATGAAGLVGTFIGGWCADRFADQNGRSYVLIPALGSALSFALLTLGFLAPLVVISVAAILIGNIATDLRNGPISAAVQNIVPSRMRATGSAMFFLASTVIGLGVGAGLLGWLSDRFAASSFAGNFADACVASQPVNASLAGEACAAASAEGLQTALAILPVTFAVAAIFFYLSSRTIRINEE